MIHLIKQHLIINSQNLIFIFIFILLPFFKIQAQQPKTQLSNTSFRDAIIVFDNTGEGNTDIRFPQGSGIPLASFFNEYSAAFNWSEDNEAKSFLVTKDDIGQIHHRYKQYYKGLELAEVQYILHEKNGKVIHANGKLVHGLDLSVEPSLSEEDALKFALASINAESYMWESKKNETYFKKEQSDPSLTMYPKGKLMLSAKDFDLRKENFHLVYRFDIYTEIPLNRYYVDVDANTGEIINKISRMRTGDVPGTGESIYNGKVSITVADTAITTIYPSKWHVNNWMAYEGVSWWIADTTIGYNGGYRNSWYEVLDTDTILLTGSNPMLQFIHRYNVEPPGNDLGYDAYDGMNVRITTDYGNTWEVLLNPIPAYTHSSLGSFGLEYNEGLGIPGWAGTLSNWTYVTFNLSNYAGKTVKIRFAFSSDPGYSTLDLPELFGWQIDNILVTSSAGTLFSNNGSTIGITPLNLYKEVTFIEGNYRLRQYGRGGGIVTYDFNNGFSAVLSTDFVDSDTYFDSEHAKAGVSVHWGLENTYDYFFNTHDRNGYDNHGCKIIAYVHVGDNWSEAMCLDRLLFFGDGPQNNIPFVYIDIIAHEYTHALTGCTADLIYMNESGAINESFSDIFGTAVEFYTLGSEANWLMGEGETRRRSMCEPKDYGDPDTYLGEYWYIGGDDNGGVHTNSGVQNYWFYLLSEGGSGVNDNGQSYSVSGIGMDAASKIAYRNLAYYLVPTSEYDDARLGSIYAAQDLFGENSIEYKSVIDAWNAVGVIKPTFVPTVGTEEDTIKFFAEAQFSSDTVNIAVSNYGLPALDIYSNGLTGSDFQMRTTPSLPITLNYDESFLIEVIFTPSKSGETIGSLVINSSDPVTPNKSLVLKGEGFTVHPAQEGQIYAMTYQTNSAFLNLNPNSGTGNQIGLTGFTRIYGLAVKPSSGQIYATMVSSESTPLLRIDSETGIAYEGISLSVKNIRAIAFDNNDDFFGASYGGDLYKIDLTNGNLTLIGSTGVSTLSSLAINPVDGQLWATPLSGDIYKIDKNNGTATLVGNSGFSQMPAIAFDTEGKFFGTINFSASKASELISIAKSDGKGIVMRPIGFPLVSGLIMRGTVLLEIEENANLQTPTEFALLQNYPNPFNPTTKISWQSPVSSWQVLKVFDVLGNEIATLVNGEIEAGYHSVELNASNLPSGVYIYKITAGDFVEAKKMILLR